jgi:hypothetical protein
MTTNEQVYVQIVKDSTGECTCQMGPMSRRQAEKVQRGANINLNHDEWSVFISPKKMEVKK